MSLVTEGNDSQQAGGTREGEDLHLCELGEEVSQQDELESGARLHSVQLCHCFRRAK